MKRFFTNQWFLATLILILSGLVFSYNLGKISLWDPDEPRGAVIAQEMLKNHDWVHLEYNGKPVTDNPALVKPPLYYWSIAAFSALQGHVDEFSARLPSMLAGIGTALLVFFLGRRIFGPRTAFLGGLIFISNHMIFEQARSAEIDMTLCLLMTTALFVFYNCYHGTYPQGRIYLAYAAMGLAVLAKGPVGVIVPVLVAFLYLIVRRDLKALPRLKPLRGTLLILLIASPWFFLEGRNFGTEFFFRQNFERFFHAFDHRQPAYYYLIKLAVHFLPWTLFLPAAITYWLQSDKEKNTGRTFLLIWFLAVFVFFSLSQSKRSLYIVPLYPALSLLVAEALDRIVNDERFASLGAWIKRGGVLLSLLLLCGGGAASYLAFSRFPDLRLHAAALAAFALAATALLYRTIRNAGMKSTITALYLIAFGVELLMAGIIYPDLDVKSRSSKLLCRMVAEEVGDNDLGCVGFHPPSAVFYIDRERKRPLIDFDYRVNDGIAFLQQKKTVFCLMNRALYEKEKDKLSKISREVHLPGLPLKGWKWDLVFLTNNRQEADQISI